MNAALISQYISGKEDFVYTILETLGYESISFNTSKKQFRFAREEGSNPTSIVLDCLSLRYYCFSTNSKGNIFTLIMERLNCTFPESLKFVCVVLGLEDAAFSINVSPPFHGFYKDLIPNNDDDYVIQTYPESVLDPYLGKFNTMFFKDGIDYKTQELYQVGYDEETDRITIPERTFDGRLCGVMGRLNDPNCKHEDRWLPIIKCSRSKTLFGLSQNYTRIVQTQTVILFESEKAPMQCHSFGSNVALSVCGCHVSNAQKDMILSLMPKKIILAFDEGLKEEDVRNEASKLLNNNIIIKNQVGYVWDEDGEILKPESKMNAADVGIEGYKKLLQTKVRWI